MENLKRKRDVDNNIEPSDINKLVNIKKELFNELNTKRLVLPVEEKNNSNKNERNMKLSWKLPHIYQIHDMIRKTGNINLKNIEKLLTSKLKHHYHYPLDLNKYPAHQATFSKTRKIINNVLLEYYINDCFRNLIESYDTLLVNKQQEDLKIAFQEWYRNFLFIFNIYIKVLNMNGITYENWIKDEMKAMRMKKDPEMAEDEINNRLFYMGLFEYLHPIRNVDGEFEHCRAFLYPDMCFLVN